MNKTPGRVVSRDGRKGGDGSVPGGGVMRPIVVGAVLILTALFAQGAEAGGPKPAPGVRPLNSGVHAQSRTVGSSTPNALQPWATSVPRPQNPAFSIEGRQTWATDPRSVFDTQAQGTAPSRRDWRDRDGDGQPDRRPGHDGPRHFKPSTVIVAPGPVYVAPSPCWSAGYWNYQATRAVGAERRLDRRPLRAEDPPVRILAAVLGRRPLRRLLSQLLRGGPNRV
jgi:hypothetical protein